MDENLAGEPALFLMWGLSLANGSSLQIPAVTRVLLVPVGVVSQAPS